MERFVNAIKSHAAALDRSVGQPRFGLVTSVDPARYAARVALQPEGVITGWLPVLSPWVGAGWGLAAPPSPGDQVLVLPQEGDAQNGLILGVSWSDSVRPPGAPPGELWLCHRSGSGLRLRNDGTVMIIGDLHVTGDIYDSHGAVSQLRGHYNAHRHADPQGDVTGPPDQLD
jgi:phage baseplate assembly protein gpV